MSQAVWEALLEPGSLGAGPAKAFLLKVQEKHNWIPKEAIKLAAKHYRVRFKALWEEVSFLSYYRTEPCGRVLVEVCQAWACRAGGAEGLLKKLAHLSGLEPGETAADGGLTVEGGGCQGICGMGPNVRVNGSTFHVDRVGQVKELLKMAKELDKRRLGGQG